MKKIVLFMAMIAFGFGLNAQTVIFNHNFDDATVGTNVKDVDTNFDVWEGSYTVAENTSAPSPANVIEGVSTAANFYLLYDAAVVAGNEYVFSASVMKASMAGGPPKLQVFGNGVALSDHITITESDTKFESGENTFTVPADVDTVSLRVYVYLGTATDIYIDDVKLVDNSATTGISDVEVLDATVYPNPLTIGSDLHVQLNEAVDASTKVEIVNINGQVVYSAVNTDSGNSVVRIGTQELSTQGIYFVKVTSVDKTMVKKIIVK